MGGSVRPQPGAGSGSPSLPVRCESLVLCRGTNTVKILLEADSLPDPVDGHLVVVSENVHPIPAPVTLVQYLRRYAGAGKTRPAELNRRIDFDCLWSHLQNPVDSTRAQTFVRSHAVKPLL